MKRALLIDAVDAKVDGSAENTVKVTGVLTHGTVASRICNKIIIIIMIQNIADDDVTVVHVLCMTFSVEI